MHFAQEMNGYTFASVFLVNLGLCHKRWFCVCSNPINIEYVHVLYSYLCDLATQIYSDECSVNNWIMRFAMFDAYLKIIDVSDVSGVSKYFVSVVPSKNRSIIGIERTSTSLP